jgi:GNAT superfamily N-acetyltransferase
MSSSLPENVHIRPVTIGTLGPDLETGRLDVPRDIAEGLPELIGQHVVNFYLAVSSAEQDHSLKPEEESYGQVAIRWDSPISVQSRSVLSEYLAVPRDEVKTPNVAFLYVPEAWRNLKIASRLLETVHADAYERGHQHTMLDVTIDNFARGAYLRRGYTSTGFIRPMNQPIRQVDGSYIYMELDTDLMIRPLTAADAA